MLTNHLAAVVLQAGREGTDVTVPQRTPSQFWIAIAVLVLGAAAALFLWYRTDFSGLPDDQQSVKSTLKQQRQDLSPVSLRIPATADVSECWPQLSRLLDAVERGSADVSLGVETHTTHADALAHARDELSQAWDPVVRRVPKRARQAIELGVLLAVFGAIAVSTSAVVGTLQGGDGLPTLPQTLETAVSITQSVVTTGLEILTAFPFADVVWAFAFAYTIITLEWIYTHWYVTASVVVLGGLVLAILEWRSDGDDSRALYDRRHTTLAVVASVLSVWVVGTVPAALAASFVAAGDLPPLVATLGAAVGFLSALALTVTFTVGAVAGLLQDVFIAAGAGVRLQRLARARPSELIRRLLERTIGLSRGTRDLPQPASGSDADWPLVGSILVRRILNVANGVLVVVLAAYVVVSVVEGRLARVLGALATAPGDTKLAIGLVVAVPTVVLALQARAAWPDIRTALAESFARQRVRVAVLGRGMPTVGVVGVTVVAYQFTQSIPVAVALGIAAGLVLYGLYVLLLKSQHAISMLETGESLPKETLVQVYPPLTVEVDGEDGQTHEEQRFYAVINGSTGVMWNDRTAFERFLRETIADCRDPDATPSSLGYWHAKDAFDHGIADPDVTDAKLDEKIRKHTVHSLREANGAIKRSEVLADLEQFPDDRREQRWNEWFADGILRRVDDLLVLEYDPWKADDRGRSS
ncbi:hypothetical protein [Natrinema pallidum]|uniref:Uncharacterized protein n=1 Tax=Natrinema pallidum TaxID=69527 RepID=A0A4P9TJY5_9EURY|nr:hypothetical protein [Natrinema pallidum]QCW05243.1 hypothetical protein FGF80_18515 [Natrinema pallidum]